LLLGSAAALASNTWGGYHWADDSGDHDNSDISLALVNHLSEYNAQYGPVLDDWDQVANGGKGPLLLTSISKTARPSACDGVATDAAGIAIAGAIHVCNGPYTQNGWLGLARIWVDSNGHIEAGVVLMNDSYLLQPESVYNNPVAWQHVLCQEIGHTFGLDHQKSPKKQSCMNDRWGLTNADFTGPNQHDFNTLNEIYGTVSGDTEDGGNSKPCNPKSPKCNPGANVHFAPRSGGGWIITYTVPPGRGSR
jgi:hypothetical protein